MVLGEFSRSQPRFEIIRDAHKARIRPAISSQNPRMFLVLKQLIKILRRRMYLNLKEIPRFQLHTYKLQHKSRDP